ncbi:hypothetical protein HPP92_027890 [Vanilla planifolia]|uniref:BHLH domain-containing protein n=1 Tax=Vanilla planifolia TaxID=51239 RepID=A0A835P9H3_VANPL|nr:hypothetical protein HPP92_027890 [Vanilla planifolia]KAG0448434.1 hypothetical protein HPP92_027840 [Vanilla planifolia]
MDPLFPYEEPPTEEDFSLWDFAAEPLSDFMAAVSQPLPPLPRPRPPWIAFSRPSQGVEWSALPRPTGAGNIHRRMIYLLRRIHISHQESKAIAAASGEGSRGFRHMMRERQRRERLSQSYADLHTMLSPWTKGDKNSVVQGAAALVRELKGSKDGLRRRNAELMRSVKMAGEGWRTGVHEASTSAAGEVGAETGEVETVTVRARSSESGIDAVICALRCLEELGVAARGVRAEFAGGVGEGLTAMLAIETNKACQHTRKLLELIHLFKINGALEIQGMMNKMLAAQEWI